jgi:hypothetical protein
VLAAKKQKTKLKKLWHPVKPLWHGSSKTFQFELLLLLLLLPVTFRAANFA